MIFSIQSFDIGVMFSAMYPNWFIRSQNILSMQGKWTEPDAARQNQIYPQR